MKAIIIPAILFVYLIVMVVLGWDSYVSGATSPLLYFGGTAVCILCIVLLHFNLKGSPSQGLRHSILQVALHPPLFSSLSTPP